jgi:ATP-binding cassette subfamily B (MDR/TAP) protein 1
LWYFITAIVAALLIFFQQYFLIHTAETLTGKLRSMMFRGILRQDIAFFDEDKNSTGALTSKLADQPQKVQGLAGVTLGTIVQSISTIVTGMIIGLIYGPKLAAIGKCLSMVSRLVLIPSKGIACIPLLVSAGYIRLRVSSSVLPRAMH